MVLVASVVWPVKAFTCPEDLAPAGPADDDCRARGGAGWGDGDVSVHSDYADTSIHGFPWRKASRWMTVHG